MSSQPLTSPLSPAELPDWILALKPADEALILAVAAANPNTVVVLNVGAPVEMPWLDQVAALVQAYYPGLEGGAAITSVLSGKVNPSGKLTISFPVHVGQQPVFYSQVRGQHGSRYADLTQEPLFPFGFGLSYTTFAYQNLKAASPKSSGFNVSVTVENTGALAGDELHAVAAVLLAVGLVLVLHRGLRHRARCIGAAHLDQGRETGDQGRALEHRAPRGVETGGCDNGSAAGAL